MPAALAPVHEPSAQTRWNLRAITADGVAFTFMVGAGERYLQMFALALGLGDLASGLLWTLPMVAGATIQLAAPWGVVRFGSQKRWTVLCSSIGAVSWVPLVIGAWRGSIGIVPLFAAVTIYWASCYASSPSWTSWVETLVPPRLRERYFARRSAACQAALFLGLVSAGTALHLAEDGGSRERVFAVFAGIFAVAAVARVVSTAFLASQSEPVPLPQGVTHVSVLGVAKRMRAEPGLRALFCFAPLMCAMQMAEPYFAPYVRNHLHADYGTYLAFVAAGFVGRIVALPGLGVLARRFGPRRMLWAGSLALVPVAMLWSLSSSAAWLISVQFLAGIAWGAVELANFLLLFNAAPHRERTAIATVYFFVVAASIAAGSLAGGWLLEACGSDHQAYMWLFAASTVARVAAFRFIAPLRK